MRKFDRTEPPEGWAENEAKWNQQWVDLLKKNEKASFAWYVQGGRTARDIALPSLKAQTQEHCSFCDGFPVDGLSPDTVEHFRPKCRDRFPDRAYSWKNLYYCCARCQSHKIESWDDDLIAPDEPGYSFERYFQFDFTTGQLQPSSIADDTEKRRAEVTIAIYGLDSPSRRRSRQLELWYWTKLQPADRQLNDHGYRDFLEPPAGTGE